MVYLSAAGIGALALTIGLVLHFKKAGKKIVPWCMLIAGFVLAGAVGDWIDKLAGAMARLTESAAGRLFGVGLPLILTVAVGIVLALHMKPKGQPPTRATPWLALLFPSILAATGLAGLAALAGSTAAGIGSSAWATIASVIGGS